MAASARLMVLMSPEERAALDVKARTLGVSAGEVVRRAVQAFELGTEDEAAELRSLIDLFNQLHPETLRIADECHRKVAEALAGPSRRDQMTRRSKAKAARASQRVRASRLEGRLVAGMALSREANPPRDRHRLSGPSRSNRLRFRRSL